jgi:tetratricopeptide (TPR) repeat protein
VVVSRIPTARSGDQLTFSLVFRGNPDTLRRRSHIVVLAVVLLCSADAHAQAPDPALERARIQLESGKVYFERGDYRRAIEQFQSADELKPAAAISFNIAQAYERWARQIGDPAERAEKLRAAVRHLRTYIKRDPGASDRGEVEKKIATLTAELPVEVRVESRPSGASVRVDSETSPVMGKTPVVLQLSRGTHTLHLTAPAHDPVVKTINVRDRRGGKAMLVQVTLKANGGSVIVATSVRGAQVFVDGKLMGRTPLAEPLVLSAGRHDVRLSRAGYWEVTRSVEVSAGTSETLSFEMRAAPRTLAIVGWSLLGAGVGAGGAGIYFGVETLRKKSDFDKCKTAMRPNCMSISSDGKSAQHLTDGLLWPGIALVAAGSVLLILDARRNAGAEKASSAAAPPPRRFSLAPLVAPGTYGMGAELIY